MTGRYARIDLLCLDEVGYASLDPRGAELLFQIITEREERASIVWLVDVEQRAAGKLGFDVAGQTSLAGSRACGIEASAV